MSIRALPILVAAACATTPPPPPKGGPRGLRASEHLDVARAHAETAREAGMWPVMQPSHDGVRWMRSWDTVADQERLARIHRSRAAELHAAYVEACGERPIEEISISPLVRHGLGGTNTATGVQIFLKGGEPDRLLAEMKCHRAWMMLAPAGMEDCPLDLPGLRLDAQGDPDGIVITLRVQDPKLVPELQRRTAHDLEVSANVHAH